MDQPLKVLFEDDQILVVDKPPGIIVTPTETDATLTLSEIVKQQYGIDLERAGIVHRLDKDTSGVLLVAKTEESLTSLQSQFKDRSVKKEYLCLVHGLVKVSGEIKGAIVRNPGDREKFIVVDERMDGTEGKAAFTKYQPEKHFNMEDSAVSEIFPNFSKIQLRKLYTTNYPQFTLLKCFPLTGRTHQIRVHLKYIGFPIVGDSKYGGRKTTRLDHVWCKRQFLHAARITFRHPTLDKEMVIESPLPADLKEALSNLTTK